MAPLRLAPGATRFKVVQFTDLHLGVDAAAVERSLGVVRAVLAAEPDVDLVVYSGDLVNADEMRAPKLGPLDAAWFASRWAKALSPLQSLGVPHAVALGNHDLRGTLGADAILEVAMAQPGSLVRRAQKAHGRSAKNRS
jgi:3',5'-cyclic AMP phosphodiesterase CpdA